MNRSVEAVVQWLIDGARSAARPQDVLSTLCARMLACGIPLCRAAVFVRTLHPNVAGRRFEWQLGENVTVSEMPYPGSRGGDVRREPGPARLPDRAAYSLSSRH
jgi:adenylate cyclase